MVVLALLVNVGPESRKTAEGLVALLRGSETLSVDSSRGRNLRAKNQLRDRNVAAARIRFARLARVWFGGLPLPNDADEMVLSDPS